jgi:hypothetical protein
MSGLRRPGDSTHHHLYSHEEPIDKKLGYQPITAWFSTQYMGFFHNFLAALHGIQEGDGTLLDRVFLLAATDQGDARLHSLTNMPFFFAGKANGRLKGGVYVNASGTPVTRAGLTALQVMGVPIGQWGTASNQVTTPITEILA